MIDFAHILQKGTALGNARLLKWFSRAFLQDARSIPAVAIGLAVIAVTFFGFWDAIVVGMPINFWGIALDSPVMALSHAINLDHWFLTGERVVKTPQTVHPGLFYQLISWVVYRLTAPSNGMASEALFDAVVRDPSAFWTVIQLVPLTSTLIAVAVLWIVGLRHSLAVSVVAVAVYFTATATLRFGIWDLFNESFALLIGVMFFMAARPAFSQAEARPGRAMIIFGLAASLVYMVKMNFFVWSLAVLPALAVAAMIGRISWKQAIFRITVFYITAIGGVLVLGYLLLGKPGLKHMLELHFSFLMGAGHYGSGPRTIISLEEMYAALVNFWNNERYLAYTIGLVFLVSLGVCVFNIRNRSWLQENLPEGVFLIGAMGLVFVALLKHYQPYYVVSISAVLPFLALWLARSSPRWIVLLLVPFIYLGVANSIRTELADRANQVVYAEESEDDAKAIRSMQIADGYGRFWVYRVIVPEFQRNFIVEFSSLWGLLQPRIVALQGPEYQFSPWNEWTLYQGKWIRLTEAPWQYLVLDKEGMKWLNPGVHSWLKDPSLKKIELKRLLVVEKPVTK